MSRKIPIGILGASFLATCVATSAHAHISLEQGGTHLSRYGDGASGNPSATVVLKNPPCGKTGGTRGTHIYTYEPGQTITVSIVEYISHPSYFRIAFDNDGDDAFTDPASIKPIDPSRKCPDGPGDHCGTSDFYNTPAVLPNMDDLNPHLADSSKTPKYTWQVTLPNVECDNCTLQVIQVMEDDLFHGPYDPTPGVGVPDVYHQCIDLVLKHGGSADGGGSPETGSAGATGAAGTGATTGEGGSNAGGGGLSGSGGAGTSTNGGGSAGVTSGGGDSGASAQPSSGDSGGCAVSRSSRRESAAVSWFMLSLAFGYVGIRRRRGR